MARTPSTMLELGTLAPDFTLPNPRTGSDTSLTQIATGKKGVLVAFICNHCPYVVHIQQAFVEFANNYLDKGLAIVAISSNDVDNYPADAPEQMAIIAEKAGYAFPYLYDESQAVAKAYRAACTPDFFLFDQDLKLVYRGQFDSSRPRNDDPITGADMRAAVDALLAGQTINADQIPSLGCNIKWKPGNEPDYYG